MGSLQAMEMAEMLEIDDALAWHLRSNHYPPVPLSMIEPCKEAIDACLEGDWLRPITLPEGVSFRGSPSAPAADIVEQHHLDAWVELDEEGLE
jgi:hypothetical protein